MTHHPTRPTLQGTFGMAASTHWLATASAQSVLERGGNACDAAVAAGFALHIVEPHLNGPGGDLTGVFATATDPTPRVLCGQGPAPADATIEYYRSIGLDAVPGAGVLAAAIPGAVDAWLLLLRDHGTWELSEVLDYALGYARAGHPVLPRVVATLERVRDLFTEHWTTSAAQWLPSGHVPKPGELIRNETYAAVLDRLIVAGSVSATREERIDAARREWGHGFVAEAVDRFVATPTRHSLGTDHAGVITGNDLAGFAAHVEDAVTMDFRGHTVAKTGAWGQGPALLQALAIIDGFDDADLDPSTANGAHLILETLKLAMADREAYYGDVDVPLKHLLSADYAASRRSLITDDASHEIRPGVVDGYRPYRPAAAVSVESPEVIATIGEPTISRDGETRGDTCHVDVVDRWGNIASITPSGGWLQSSPTIPELGFCLGTRLQMTWLDPAAPSALRPGVRPRTTLPPTLLLRDGLPVAALGTPGGDGQDQWQLLYLLRVLVGGMDAQDAIDAPAFRTTSMASSFWPRTWTPGGADVEDRLGADVIDDLERRGHVVTRTGPWSQGRLSTVTRDPATGLLSAAANPRGRQGYAAGR